MQAAASTKNAVNCCAFLQRQIRYRVDHFPNHVIIISPRTVQACVIYGAVKYSGARSLDSALCANFLTKSDVSWTLAPHVETALFIRIEQSAKEPIVSH